MRNRGLFFWGIALIVAGVAFLIAEMAGISGWALFWPLLLIGFGLWILLRPRMVSKDTYIEQTFVGDLRRRGAWQAGNEEFTSFVGDVDLDLTEAEFPNGEARYRVTGFVGDVKVRVPADVGVQVESSGFVSDVEVFGQKISHIFEPVHYTSPNFATAEKKFRLSTAHFVSEVKIRQV